MRAEIHSVEHIGKRYSVNTVAISEKDIEELAV